MKNAKKNAQKNAQIVFNPILSESAMEGTSLKLRFAKSVNQRVLNDNIESLFKRRLVLRCSAASDFYGRGEFAVECKCDNETFICTLYARYGQVCIGAAANTPARVVLALSDAVRGSEPAQFEMSTLPDDETHGEVLSPAVEPVPEVVKPAAVKSAEEKPTRLSSTKSLTESVERILREFDKVLFDDMATVYEDYLRDGDFAEAREQLHTLMCKTFKKIPFDFKVCRYTERPFGVLIDYYGLKFGYKLFIKDGFVESKVLIVNSCGM